ncbi:MAG: tRNA pseudouridine(55) synthase TruB [Aristaeellaceae bacterium]
MNGFLNILKPPGMTSAAVVAVVRRMTGEKRVGHAGTLDPEAAGVLPIMVGKAARLFDYLVDKEKEYVAEAAFGAATDTQDATGQVIVRGDRYPDEAQLTEAARKLTGDIWQRPSMYSAIKQDGKPMYERARAGETVEVPLRQVHVASIELHGMRPNHGLLMTVRCGKGTYIRSICSDMGDLVGCPAHMRFLLRSRSGAFTLETAMTLEEAAELAQRGELHRHLLPLDMPLQHLPRVDVAPRMAKKVINGVQLPLRGVKGAENLTEGQATRVYLNGAFWGMASREQDALHWRALIAPEVTA